MKTLESELIEVIRQIDSEQTEGGVYALPDRHSKGKRPAAHHQIFGGKIETLNLCKRLGLPDGKRRLATIDFTYENEACSLRFLDFATTKVRSYGNRYQLDTRHGKKWEDRSEELRDAVSDLAKEAKRGWSRCDRYLLIAFLFTDTEKHAMETLSLSTAPEFIDRYRLTVTSTTWPDPHGRRMWTTAACWSAQRPKNQSSVSEF